MQNTTTNPPGSKTEAPSTSALDRTNGRANGRVIRGAGIGLRTPHFDALLENDHKDLWLELLADNWLYDGLTLRYLEAFAERYPLTLHSTGLSIGGCSPLDMGYLQRLKNLARKTQSPWLSDHLCFTEVHGKHFPDLLPLPYTEESIAHVANRIRIAQDYLAMPLVIENVSSYVEYKESTLTEAEFISAICEEADCGLLLDINNIYVSERNHGHDAWRTIENLPLHRVKEIHLAGFSEREIEEQTFLNNHPPKTCVIDTHDQPVHTDVWKLFTRVAQQLPEIPVLIEWDNNIPPLEKLLAEAQKAQTIIDKTNTVPSMPNFEENCDASV